MRHTRRWAVVLIGLSLLGLAGCATVPKEAVQLSYAVGQDIEQLHTGYQRTIRFSFDQIRQRGLGVIENVWTPAYLTSFVKDGNLVEAAQSNQIDRVEFWARLAIEAIDKKRQEFLRPLQQQENALLADIDDAFGRVIRANSAVTAHLNSVLKVQDLQTEVLESAGLKDVRDKINAAIDQASDFAASATSEIETAAAAFEPDPS